MAGQNKENIYANNEKHSTAEAGGAGGVRSTAEAGGAGGKHGIINKRNSCNKTIILTGGGTAGHVIPNLVLLPLLLDDGWEVHYIGSRRGIEATLTRGSRATYHAVQTGKLRRYFSFKNLFDPFKVLAGICQSVYWVAKLKPAVIFSKGGFVAAPAVLGGRLLGTPAVIHESDMSPGLANRMCAPFAAAICLSFEKTMDALPAKSRAKAVYTGTPVRPGLGAGDAGEGYRLCGFNKDKPVLLAIGGSMGSECLNAVIRNALPGLLTKWQVAHICGSGNTDTAFDGIEGYAQFGYVDEEIAHLYKISRAAVSRAGSNTIFELLDMRIPSVLIPLPATASRGDQLLNAAEFEKSGFSLKLEEKEITDNSVLPLLLETLDKEHGRFTASMDSAHAPDSAALILGVIYKAALQKRIQDIGVGQ